VYYREATGTFSTRNSVFPVRAITAVARIVPLATIAKQDRQKFFKDTSASCKRRLILPTILCSYVSGFKRLLQCFPAVDKNRLCELRQLSGPGLSPTEVNGFSTG